MITGLVVSCQPVPGSPFDTIDGVVAFARAAASSGARGLRIEGVANVAAVRGAVDLPVIGLVKRDLAGFEVRITVLLEDVAALADAGAAIIAVDATDRLRPVPVADLVALVHARGRLAMADCATFAEARAAVAWGADIVGSTLSGYTGGAVPVMPDLALVRAMAALGRPVFAEGRYNAPELAAAAMYAGADAVVVGSAITRPEYVTSWFCEAVEAARAEAPVLAFDIGGTKTLVALVQGRAVLEVRQVPTDREVSAVGWTEALAALAAPWHGRYARCAIAATGVFEGDVWSALNADVLDIPAGFRLADAVSRCLGVSVLAVNDAQAAAWGEYRFGAGVGRDLVFVTVSTGIGGGIVTGGRLLRGARGLAGSLGSLRLGGRRLEDIGSGRAIARGARDGGRDADARGVFAARAEPWAAAILEAAAQTVADALLGVQALVDPELIVIGGGVGLAPGFLEMVRAAMAAHAPVLVPALVPAALGAQAGIIGAASLEARAVR